MTADRLGAEHSQYPSNLVVAGGPAQQLSGQASDHRLCLVQLCLQLACSGSDGSGDPCIQQVQVCAGPDWSNAKSTPASLGCDPSLGW